MKKLTLILLLLLTGCSSGPDEDEFMEYGSNFYQQMFIDGEQSEAVIKLHDKMTEYEDFQEDELYITLEKMYEALEDDPVNAAGHQVEVMNILNK